jgi:hypothetical protein
LRLYLAYIQAYPEEIHRFMFRMEVMKIRTLVRIGGEYHGLRNDILYCAESLIVRSRTLIHSFIHSFIHQWLHSPLVGPGLPFSFLIVFTQTVGLLGPVISPSQGRYLHTGQHKHRLNAHIDIHALSGCQEGVKNTVFPYSPSTPPINMEIDDIQCTCAIG